MNSISCEKKTEITDINERGSEKSCPIGHTVSGGHVMRFSIGQTR
jgi:hypothetical protein